MNDTTPDTPPPGFIRQYLIDHGLLRPRSAPVAARGWIDRPTLRLLGNENVGPVSFMRMIELEQRP